MRRAMQTLWGTLAAVLAAARMADAQADEELGVTAITYNIRRSYLPPAPVQNSAYRINLGATTAWVDKQARDRTYTDARGGSATGNRGLLGWDDNPPHEFARRATAVVRTALTPPPAQTNVSVRAPTDFIALQEVDPTQRAMLAYAARDKGYRVLSDYGHFAMNPLLYLAPRWRLLRSGWAQGSSTPWLHDNCGPNGQAAPRAGACNRATHGGATWGRHIQWAVFAPKPRARYMLGRENAARAPNASALRAVADAAFVPYWDSARMKPPTPPELWRDADWQRVTRAAGGGAVVLVVNLHWPLTASKVLPAAVVAGIVANVTKCLDGACTRDAAPYGAIAAAQATTAASAYGARTASAESDAAAEAAAAISNLQAIGARHRRLSQATPPRTRVHPIVLGDFNALAVDPGVTGLASAAGLKNTWDEALPCGIGGDYGRRCPGPSCATNDAWSANARSNRVRTAAGACTPPHAGAGKIDHVLVGTDARVTGAGVVPCGGVAGDPLACPSDHNAVWARLAYRL